jgi:hypothetical protein
MAKQTRIKGLIPVKNKLHIVDIFGYQTKSLPGLEIVGLGKFGRSMKEKFIYVSRFNGLKIPMKRYVLCIEHKIPSKDLCEESIQWLELPLLILFWSLSNNLPISRLDDCFACGNISVTGDIAHLSMNQQILMNLHSTLRYKDNHSLKYLAPSKELLIEDVCHLELEEIFSGKNGITFVTRKLPDVDFSINHDMTI